MLDCDVEMVVKWVVDGEKTEMVVQSDGGEEVFENCLIVINLA